MSRKVCLDDMHIFTVAAQNKSITRASEMLCISKQTVSRKIAKLEEALSVLLIARTTRSFELTAAGLDYYEMCVKVFEQVHQANDVISEFQKSAVGTIKIGFPLVLNGIEVADVLAKYLQHNPDLDLQIRYMKNDYNLSCTGVDIAFRLGDLDDSSMVARKLGQVHFSYAASPEYLAQRAQPKRYNELQTHKFITVEGDHKTKLSFNSTQATQSIEVNDFLIAKSFLMNHFGIALMPLFLIWSELQSGKLVLIDDTNHFKQDLHIVFLRSRLLPSYVRNLIDFLVCYDDQSTPWKLSLT